MDLDGRIEVVTLRRGEGKKGGKFTTLVLTVPKSMLERTQWKEGDRMVLRQSGRSLLVETEKDFLGQL